MREYKYKPPHASSGSDFADLCIRLLNKFVGKDLIKCETRADQHEIGDAHGGYEFKHLQRSYERLHIEIAENNDRVNWFGSGVYAPNRNWFLCGSDSDVWCFAVEDLVRWHQQMKPEEVWYGEDSAGKWRLGAVGDPDLAATIHSFVLHKWQAEKIYTLRFQQESEVWSMRRRDDPPAPPPSLRLPEAALNHLLAEKKKAVAAYNANPGDETWRAAAEATKAANGGKWP